MVAAFFDRAKRYQALTLLAGALLALAAFAAATRYEENERRHDFLELANDHAVLVRTAFVRAAEAGLAAAMLFDGESAVRRDRFRTAVAPLLKNNAGIRAIEWIPRVPAADRVGLEAAARRDGFPDFAVAERDAGGQVTPAAPRDEYFPVYYAEPLVDNAPALGFDLASDPTRAQGMARARDSGRSYASDRVRLVQGGHRASLIFTPAYRGGVVPASVAERRENLIGFSLVVLEPNIALASVMATDDDRHAMEVHRRATGALAIYVFDDNLNANERLLAAHGVADIPGAEDREPTEVDAAAGLHFTRALEMAGRTWEIVIHPTAARDGIPGWAWGTLALCLGLAGVGSILVRVRVGRDQAIHRLVDRQTAELATTAQALRELHEIAAEQGLSLNQKIEWTLRLGIRHFDLPLGIVSEIEGERYAIRDVLGPEWAPARGAVFAFDETYCSVMLARGRPLGVVRAGVSDEFKDHPCYRAMRLEAYLGAPIRIEGRLGGTLSFTSPVPRDKPFSDGDLSLIQMMAEWIGTLMARRRQIERLEKTNAELESFKATLDSTEDCVFMFAPDTLKFFYVNRGAVEQVGYSAAELMEMTPLDVKPDFNEAGFRAMLKPLVEGAKRSTTFETVHRAKDGRRIPVEILLQYSKPASGPPRFVAVVRDATERKRAERELRDSENRLSAIFKTAMDGIITIDERGLMETVNPAAEALFGYPAAEMIGRNVKMLMPEPHASRHDGYLESYRRTGRAKILGAPREIAGRRKDGSEFPLDLVVTEVSVGGRRLFVGLARDLTERKRIERLHKEFVSTVSHELRTPLTSIMGSLGLVRGGALGALPDKVNRLVEIAHANSDRLVRLINDILDVDRIESGKFEFRMTPVDLSGLVEQAVETNRGYAERFKVGIDLARPVEPATVLGDADRLAQVMANLLSNAAKFSPVGGTIGVAIARREDWVRVSVRDRGPGIPLHFRDKIFGKFSQADASDSRIKGGTGLGLSITKAIVDRHGGRVWFEDAEDRGTVFHVELPRVDRVDRREDTAPPGAGRRILVCEDDRDTASVLAMILRPAGFAVDTAYTLAAAREMLATRRYDALSLDLVLPDGDGIHLIRALRANPRTAGLPVVVVSARAREGRAVVNGHAVGIVDWLEKPIRPERLLAALDVVFRRAAEGRARILHVEDDAAVREVVAALIGDRAAVTAAATLAEARDRLGRERFDLVILDLRLPDGSGKEILSLLKPANGQPATPVLVLSMTETDAGFAGEVDAALVKSLTSNENLLNTILSMIPAAPDEARPQPGNRP